ncbi:hypothetical protein Poly59_14120 [Rubripirellula reticaptiva]|uniref:Uncharacterized protein n=1 Tax=Rubripirellula reticaptiva TaxID=2528013 RepID=A0A5C6F4X4_9BACT|nr:hypothetical protein Poly59_14120 [Rubripirellula reticaptiva]
MKTPTVNNHPTINEFAARSDCRRRFVSRLATSGSGRPLSIASLVFAITFGGVSGAADVHGDELTKPRPIRMPLVSVEPDSVVVLTETPVKPFRMPATDPTAPKRELQFDSDGFSFLVFPELVTPSNATAKTEPAETAYDLLGFEAKVRANLVSDESRSERSDSASDGSSSDLDTPVRMVASDCLPITACVESPFYNDFSPTPVVQSSLIHDGDREQWVYDAKHDVPTQHPWVEWGRIFYGDGITPRGRNWFGETNLARPKFYMYGDFRTGVASGRNAAGRTDNWANRLNLDMDLQITESSRFHSFVGPIDNNGAFTRFERVAGDYRFRDEIDFTPVTAFFEGDIGTMIGGATGQTSPFELPVTLGLVPLLFQNGIWMEDAVTGAAFALPSRNNRYLKWSNYDATFFAVFDQLNSAAFAGDEHAAQAFGTAWFIEAYGGYIETGYAYVRDRNNDARSYHNVTASFTKRYFDRISNSIRVIVNAGQDLAKQDRTADGALFLFENSWITAAPLTVVPYANFFVGWDRPQSVARAGGSGGILRNTGINFDTDGLNGFATLDPTASDTAGASLGVDLIGDDLNRQLLLEVSYLTPHGDKNAAVPDDQFATGTRYQFPISNWSLLRFDMMYGWRRGLEDVYGTRMEYRWKF